MVHVSRYFVFAAAFCIAGGPVAQTVYKSVDEKGNVSYSESPPADANKGRARSTTELPIDPNQNVMPAYKPAPAPPLEQPAGAVAGDERSRAERIAEAEAALTAAEAQLKAGSDVQPGDFLGRAGGGVGPSPQRLQRLQDLQRAVEEAKANLERVQAE